jgi:hypothetical protein
MPEVVARYWPDAGLVYAIGPEPDSRWAASTWCSERLLGVGPAQGDEPCAVALGEVPPKWRHITEDERRDSCVGAMLSSGARGCRSVEVWLVAPAERA